MLSATHLSNVVCALPQGFEDLFVVFQVDVGEHVSGHCVSFAQVGLQAFFVDLLLKLGDDWPRLNQADTDNRQRGRFLQSACKRVTVLEDVVPYQQTCTDQHLT